MKERETTATPLGWPPYVLHCSPTALRPPIHAILTSCTAPFVRLAVLQTMNGDQQTSNVTVVPSSSPFPSFFNRLGRSFTRYRQKAGTFFVISLLTSIVPAVLATGGAYIASAAAPPDSVGLAVSALLPTN